MDGKKPLQLTLYQLVDMTKKLQKQLQEQEQIIEDQCNKLQQFYFMKDMISKLLAENKLLKEQLHAK